MSLYKQKLNTRTGQFNLVPSGLVITFKPGVANVAALPAVGNTQNDARITNDAGHLYVWDGVSWIDQGDIIDLNWTAITGRPSSSVSDIDDAVSKKHTQETDKYLTTAVTNTLYVDGNRGDSYTANGSITKPFKKIQDAIDATISPSITNKYLIEIAPGAYYTDALAINKPYLTFRSSGLQGGRISGAITVTNPSSPTPEQITFIGLRISGGLTCLASHIAINCIDCNVTGTTWTFNPTVPTDDEYLQVFGGLWYANATLTNVYAYLMGGGYYSTFIATNKEFNINNADINDPFQVTLNGTIIASAYGDRAGNSKFIVNSGATLNIDADTDGGSVVTENVGSIINRTTTRLGALTADLDMNDHSIVNLKDDSITFKSGGSITKADYEDSVNNTKASFVKSAIAFPPVSAVSGDKYLITPPASGLFTAAGGSVGDYLTIPITSTLKPGSGEFCYEIDLTLDIMPTVFDSLVGQYENANAKRVWRLGVIPAGGGLYQWRFDYSINGIAAISKFYNDTITTGIKYRICIQRTGNDLKFFRDGVQLGITADMTGVTLFDTDAKLTIATYGGIGGVPNPNGAYCHRGRLGEIKMSNISRYAGNYTPSTTINAVDANTILLLHCFGADGSTTFTDECGNPVTVYRNAHIDTGDYFRTTIWTPNANDIAVYNGATYDFITKKEGFAALAADEKKVYVCDGINWVRDADYLKTHTQNSDQYLDYGGVNQINASEITKKLFASWTTYYVDPVLGLDINSGLTALLPLKTIARADVLIPDNLNGQSVGISLAPGIYTEQFQPRNRQDSSHYFNYQIFSSTFNPDDVIWKASSTGFGVNVGCIVKNTNNSKGMNIYCLLLTFDSNNISNCSLVQGNEVSVVGCKFTKSGIETDVTAIAGSKIYSQQNINGSIPVDYRFTSNSLNNDGYVEHDGYIFANAVNNVFYSYVEYHNQTQKRYFRTYGGGDAIKIGSIGDMNDANVSTPANIYDAVQKKHSPNTDTGTNGNFAIAGELSIQVFSQTTEPTLTADNRMAIWIDTDDSNRVYLLFRRGSGDQVAVELG